MRTLAQGSSTAQPGAVTRVQLYASPLEGGHGPLGDDRQERSQQTATRVPTRPILVVDDDQAILMTITEILALEGYPFITAADGAEALRQIAAQQPALVLLDMRMPILNGWEVARMLRERGIMVPIVVMTAAQDARLWSEQIDAAGYLAKPFDLDDLLDTIARFVSD